MVGVNVSLPVSLPLFFKKNDFLKKK